MAGGPWLSGLRWNWMTPAESAVGRAWVSLHQGEFEEIQVQHEIGHYNALAEMQVRLQADPATYLAWRRATTVANTPPSEVPGDWRVTRNWVDIVGRVGAAYTLVEVKDVVKIRARRQILGYRDAWLQEYPSTVVSQLVVAGRVCEEWLVRALQREGIRVELFPGAN